MRLDESEQSENLEDVRGSGGGFGGGLPIPGGRGGLGIGTIIVLGLIGYAFGIDPRILIGGAELLSGGGGQVMQQTQQQPQHRGAALRRIRPFHLGGARQHGKSVGRRAAAANRKILPAAEARPL